MKTTMMFFDLGEIIPQDSGLRVIGDGNAAREPDETNGRREFEARCAKAFEDSWGPEREHPER